MLSGEEEVSVMLEIKNITCYYGVICALKDVTITIPDDGIYAIIDAN